MKSANGFSKPVLIMGRELALIGLAVVLIAITRQNQSTPLHVSPDVQPVNMSPDTTTESSTLKSA